MAQLVRARGWLEHSHPRNIADIAFLALTVVLGLQVFRVLLVELVFYLRDSLGSSPAVPGIYALALFLVPFSASWVSRLLGPRYAVMLTAGGLALARLIEQFITWPAADLALATIGTAFFLLFIPIYIGRASAGDSERGGRTFVLGFLLGISIDTAVKGVFATLDLSWQPGAITYLIVALLVGLQWLLLSREVRAKDTESTGGTGFRQFVPVMALGPVLFLELLLFQNIGQQTALINWDQPVVFLWTIFANLVGIVAGVLVMARPGYGILASLIALAGLFALLVSGEHSGVWAALSALYGQAVVSMSIGMIGVAIGHTGYSPSHEGSSTAPITGVRGDRNRRIGGVAAASGIGMLFLLVLAFVYYSSYQFDIPGGASIVPPIGAAIIFLAVLGMVPLLIRHRAGAPTLGLRSGQVWAAVPVAVILLVMPLGYLAAWDEPSFTDGPSFTNGTVQPSGFPVRVMSYNLHQAFDIEGYMAIEAQARDIEEMGADIVALQEVSRGWLIDGSFDMLVWLSRRLDMPYVWGPSADSVWGNAILSRYPIHNARTQPMPNNSQLQLKRSFTTAQVDVGGGETLTIIATHLHHVEEDSHLRVPQVEALIAAWDMEERTVLLGDLNASPGDPEMAALAEAGLKDTFVISGIEGNINGFTWTPKDPHRRIDYIWVSGDLGARDFALTGSIASDHLGLAVTVEPD
jgi:endonuclease/exonuclease/phosphatase family metal-dependent hydrolase